MPELESPCDSGSKTLPPVGFIDYSLSLLTDTKSQNVLEVRTPYIYTKPTRGHYGANEGCIWPYRWRMMGIMGGGIPPVGFIEYI